MLFVLITETSAHLPLGSEVQSKEIEKGLTTFQVEEEHLETERKVRFPRFTINNPYPDQTPSKILERWYNMNSFTITKSSGASLGGLCNAYNIFSKISFHSAVRSFKYFKFEAIEFRFQYSSTPMVYGHMFLTSVPQQFFHGVAFLSQIASADDAVIIDFAEQQEVVITTGWRSPSEWLDLTTDQNTNFASLYNPSVAWPVNPVKVLDSAMPGTVTVLAFMRFIKPELAGHIDPSTFPEIDYAESQTSLPTTTHDLQHPNPFVRLASYAGRLAGMAAPAAAAAAPAAAVSYAMSPGDPMEAISAVADKIAESDPDLRPSVYGSMVYSPSRYVLGTGGVDNYMPKNRIVDYIRKPTYLGSLTLPTSTTVPALLAVAHPAVSWSRINFVSQVFRYWRGTYKFSFVIISSPFVTARYNFGVCYSAASGVVGDELIKDVTVRGTTIVEFDVPYLAGNPWGLCPLGGASTVGEFYPSIYVLCRAPPSSATGDITPTLTCLIYESAGENFEFRCQRSPGYLKTSIMDEAESQMLVSTLCKGSVIGEGTKADCINGFSSKELVTFEDLGARWQKKPYPGIVYPLTNFPTATKFSMTTRDLFGGIFVFQKGGIKVKMIIDPSDDPSQADIGISITDSAEADGGSSGAYQADKVESGMSIINSAITRTLEFTLPFLSNYDFVNGSDTSPMILTPVAVSTRTAVPFFCQAPLTTVNVQGYYIANAEDFTYIFDVPPPGLIYWPTGVTPPEEDVDDSSSFTNLSQD